jgi:NADH:ubiquinone oxidoreductase subunit 5 (subunit L)/multisubunit Na+/H+ antiporter MnhA subunit
MLKTAVYGMLRVVFDLIGDPEWWWGLAALVIGLATALFGVVFAAVQTDMKRLLAWSSIENIGIAFSGLGLAVLFSGFDQHALAALALLATLYHCLNHACFKSLLFLATGSVLHATGERNLGKLGGLIRYMPWVAALALVGTLAIAGLPPLNGFVAEWLLLQVFLFTAEVPRPFIDMLVPLGAALLALVAALSAYVMVKFYGVIFLGQPREATLAEAHDAGLRERLGLGWLALCCVLLGIFPVHVLRWLDQVGEQLLGTTLGERLDSWWLLSPISAERASYGPLALLAGIALAVLATGLLVRFFYHARVRRVPAWDCGFGGLDARMQDTAEGFGQPIRRIFAPLMLIRRTVPSPFDREPTYAVEIEDPIWVKVHAPLGRAVQAAAGLFTWLQRGRVATYLLYSFLTLLTLLVLVL